MLRKGLGAFLFIAVIGIIFHTSDAFAEIQQFTVDPFKAVNLKLHLDKGDELQWTLVVSGEDKNNIFFYINTPSGATQFSAFCSTQYSSFSPSKCNEGGSFIAAESGTYQFLFDNGVLEEIPTTFTFEYNITKNEQGGGCLIATATYGTELASPVQQLRELRDNSLLQTRSGSSFMESFNQFYYLFSPTIADLERQNPVFKDTVKLAITPLITSLSILNYVDIDSDQEMLAYGIGVILLNMGMYFVAPAIIILKIKNKLN